MNGVHDMGGMQGFGPIRPEANEPVFHDPWEGRVFALSRAVAARGAANLDAARFWNESLPPADYLSMSYYEKWFVRLGENMVTAGAITRAELNAGRAVAGTQKAIPLTVEQVAAYMSLGTPKSRDVAVRPTFRVGQRVRARNINPTTHTRLPRYARGKTGVVVRDYGIFVFPDTNALFQGEKPQHLYSVRFEARELWGEQAKPKDTVFIDMWDDYLERA
jgi:nitrile hydratase subunit beta